MGLPAVGRDAALEYNRYFVTWKTRRPDGNNIRSQIILTKYGNNKRKDKINCY
jgi:hypothetical protein